MIASNEMSSGNYLFSQELINHDASLQPYILTVNTSDINTHLSTSEC